MEVANKSLYKLDSDVAIVPLFFATAYLAGSKRFIKVFPTANRQGLMFAAATSSLGLVGSRRTEKGTPFYLVSRCILVATAALFTTPWVAKTFGREAKILAQDVGKFSRVTTAVMVGTHLTQYLETRYLKSSLSKSEQLELESLLLDKGLRIQKRLKRAIDLIEKRPSEEWKMSRVVDRFNPDKILADIGEDDVINNDDYKGLFDLQGDETVDARVKENAIALLLRCESHHYAVNNVGEKIRWYLNKVLLYLVLKKQAFVQDAEKTPEKKEALLALIRKTMERIDDAHNGCSDQQTVQMKWLAIEIIDDSGLSETAKIVGLELEKYRAALLDECVAKTDEAHAADLGVDLARVVARERRFPLTKANGDAAVNQYYSRAHFEDAKKSFDENYNPAQYLLDQAKYYTGNKVFADMCQWYGLNVFPVGLEEKIEKERIEILGSDFSSSEDMDKIKDSAVLYYLLMNDLIMAK